MTYRATATGNAPQTYYRLGDLFGTTARDDGAAGNGYDGTLQGSVTLAQSGLLVGDPGLSMKFLGSNDGSVGGSISLPSAFKVDGWTAFSLVCWLKLSSTAFSDYARVASNDFTQSDKKGFELILNPLGAGITFTIGNGAAYSSATNSATLSGATVYQLAVIWNGSTITAYVNAVGGAGVSFLSGGGIGAATNAISLGYCPALGANYAPIWLQEVSFYNYALTQAQLSADRTAGTVFAASPWTATISRKPVTLQAGSLSVDLAVSRASTASFVVRTPSSTHFQQYQPVAIYDTSGVMYTSGYINTVTARKAGFQSSLLHSVVCMDQHWLADKRVVYDIGTNLAKIYAGKSYDSIVQDIVTTFLAAEGVTIGSLYGLAPSATLAPSTSLAPLGPSTLIPLATLNFPTAAQVFDALAKASATTGVNFYWYIDQWKRLYFLPYTATTAAAVDGATIDDGRLSNRAPSISNANPLYYNRQYVVGGTDGTNANFLYFVGDGVTTSWTMPLGPLTVAPTIWIGGSLQTVGKLNSDPGKAFYWSPGSAVISAVTAPASGTNNTIIYNPAVPSNASASNATQITAQAAIDGTSGIVESVVKDTSITRLTAGIAEATANLARNAQRGALFTYTTRDTGHVPGQYRAYTFSPFNLSATSMLIESVHLDDSADGLNIWYTCNAVVGPIDSTWVNFFGGTLNTPPPAQSISIGV